MIVIIAQIGLLLSSTSLPSTSLSNLYSMSYSCLHSLYAAHADPSRVLALCDICCILAGGGPAATDMLPQQHNEHATTHVTCNMWTIYMHNTC